MNNQVKIKLGVEKLKIRASLEPSSQNIFENWEKYTVIGLIGKTEVGYIYIKRVLDHLQIPKGYEEFFLDTKLLPPMPKPWISYKYVEEDFRGNGICGRMTELANEFYRGKLGTTLFSDISFESEESKKVWKKLTDQGLAVFGQYRTDEGKIVDRWNML